VSGVGAAKLARYGAQVLAVLAGGDADEAVGGGEGLLFEPG
jgi:hypothetical protein